MSIMRSIHTLITLGISTLLLIGLVLPHTEASSQVYPDNIWEDTFDDNTDVTLTNCDIVGGAIVLNQTLSQVSYNFATQKNHEAYAFRSSFFFPIWKYYSPQRHLGSETKFGNNDIFKIKAFDQDYAERSSKGLFFSDVAHHFRFKIDIDPATLDYLLLRWYGKTDSRATVSFYYYNASSKMFPRWESLGNNATDGKDFSVVHRIRSGALKLALKDTDYLDIIVVCSTPFRVGTLSTNYIEILGQTAKGYSLKDASAVTKTDIVPYNLSTISKTKFYWEMLTWEDYQPPSTEARYHVLYMNSTGIFKEIEETVLPGNHKGFLTSPVYLNNLSNDEYGVKYNKLKILVNLSTDSPAVSPRIFSWALTWQNKSHWLDSFNTLNRVDSRSKINMVDGTILISSTQDEWPLFGYDSANTRASGGKGAASNNLYWFSAEDVGGGFRSPVVGNGYVYIVSNTNTLHQYPVLLPNDANEGEPLANTSSISFNSAFGFDNPVVSSPAVTDSDVIVATGKKAPTGTWNYIYGFSHENLSAWPYYKYPEKACFDASPIVEGSWIFITTWGGDNKSYLIESQRYTNNKLLAMKFNSVSGIQSVTEHELPAPCFSSPAVTSDKIIVTCSSAQNDSVIALSRTADGNIGDTIWSKALGAVGHASPVIYEDTVFVTCAEVSSKKSVTKLVALNLNDGTILWNKTLGTPSSSLSNVAESTPAVYNDVLYAASADGSVYALHTINGSQLWTKKIYTVPIRSDKALQSSPAYAEGRIYIGTPAGMIYALDASSGDTIWEYETFPIWTAAPVSGSPAVSSGLAFISDDNGVLYSLGRFTTSTKQVSGRIISQPIPLPESLWWDSFYADYSILSGVSSITFKLLDANGNILNDNLANRSSLISSGLGLDRAIRLQADFSSSNLTKNNPELFRWYITLTSDVQEPFLNSTSFTPPTAGWTQEIFPVFTIKVKDNGTGLRVHSGSYTLEYTMDNLTYQSTSSAGCTGTNGTTSWQTLTMNISLLPDYENISSLKKLTFNITDLAGNEASKTITFKQDVKKPTSRVLTTNMKPRYNLTAIRINATANDTGTLNVDASGVRLVELYYRYSETKNFSGKEWVYFANSTKTSPTWLFNFTNRPNQPGGYFELSTIATDIAGNNESFPATGDVSFLYDWKAPSLPSVSGDTLWFKERPQFSVIFEDDYRIDTIQYRPNFDTIWTTLSSHVNKSVYNTDSVGNTWILSETYWNQMEEGVMYTLYIRVNDTLGNAVEILEGSDAIKIMKDTAPPLVTIDIPSVQDEWSLEGNFTVSGQSNDHQGSGIKEALLYYRYSEDKSNWTDWATYGDVQDSSPFGWDFDAVDGDGYYEMKIIVTDNAGNEVESEVFPLSIASFPTTLALILVGLLTVLIFLSIIIFLSWRKKEAA